MKKVISILMVFIIGTLAVFTLSACSNDTQKTSSSDSDLQNPSDDSKRPKNENIKRLVVYFSVPDNKSNSYVERHGEKLGNTQYMAYIIQENTGANIFRILPKTPYPTNHNELLAAAQKEIRTNARPEIDGVIENFDSYDMVFVGYPNWNADMPYILYTFFETYDFSGKTIIPFNTHGGSGFSDTQKTIAELEPNAKILEGLSISRNDIENSEQKIMDWLRSIGMLKAGNER